MLSNHLLLAAVDPTQPLGALPKSVYAGMLVVFLGIWGLYFYFIGLNPAILRAAPRRMLPWWRGIDVLLVFVLYIVCVVGAQIALLLSGALDPEPPPMRPTAAENEPTTMKGEQHNQIATNDTTKASGNNEGEQAGESNAPPAVDTRTAAEMSSHPLFIMMREQPYWWAQLVVVLSACVVAPLFEEFMYRLMLQGYLESLESWLRHLLILPRAFIRGALPIALVSAFFASNHARDPSAIPRADALLLLLGTQMVCSIVVLTLSVVYLRIVRKATLADFGISIPHLPMDIGLGVLTFALIFVPLFGAQLSLQGLFPPPAVVDPYTIFLFSCTLGFLYFRTHRIVPSIVLHMCLNGFSTAMMFTYLYLAPQM